MQVMSQWTYQIAVSYTHLRLVQNIALALAGITLNLVPPIKFTSSISVILFRIFASKILALPLFLSISKPE